MKCFGMLMDGRAQPTGIRKRGEAATLLLVVNGHHDVVNFMLPEWPGGRSWQRLIDTNLSDEGEPQGFPPRARYQMTARSLLLLLAETGAAAKPAG
jgi:glycogen operon protein